MQVQWTYIVISTTQTDLGFRSRTFSLIINKLPTFSEKQSRVAIFNDCVYTVRSAHILNSTSHCVLNL